MRAFIAIAISLGLLVLTVVLTGVAGVDCVTPMVLLTAIWAAIDSKKIELKKYKSGVSYGPIVLFILCLAIWIVGFPWYLIVRARIKAGEATLKPER